MAHQTAGLCDADDFLWLLDRGCDDQRTMTARQNYLEVARWLPWMSQSAHVDAWLAVREVDPVRLVLGYPVSVDLNSDEARELREQWATMKELGRSPEVQPLQPPPHERLLRALELAKTKDVRFFINVCGEMTLEPTSTHYGFERFLTRSPGWLAADSDTKAQIVSSAKHFLSAEIDDPESCREESLNSILPGGMAAVWLILEIDPVWLASRAEIWWQRWCWYILRELHPNMVEEPNEPKNEILTRLHEATPATVRHEIARIASNTSADTHSLLSNLLRLLDNISDPELDDELCRMLASAKIRPDCVGTVAQFVLARRPADGVPVCLGMLEIPGPDSDESSAVQAAVSLLSERASNGWSGVSKFLSLNEHRGRRVLRMFAHGSRLSTRLDESRWPLEALAAGQLGELAALLLQLFPPESDPVREGAWSVGPDDSARELRDRVISALGVREEQAAVDALRQLEHRFGAQYAWLRRPRAAAERSYRLSQWFPIPLDVIAKLLASSDKRLLRSDDDVLDATEAALDAYGEALRQDGIESVEALWNTAAGVSPSPKAEEHVSSKLCGAVRSYFSAYAIAADREVEIHRRTIPRSGGGEPRLRA